MCIFYLFFISYHEQLKIIFQGGTRFRLLQLALYLCFLTISIGIHGLLNNSKCVSSINGAALVKHSYKSFAIQDVFSCYYKCKHHKLCQSLNFYTAKNLCELNNRTRFVGYGNFILNAGAIYLDNPFRGELLLCLRHFK